MRAIAARELKSYFTAMTGYVFCAFVLLFAGIYLMVLNLNYGYPNFEYVLSSMSLVLLIAIPILTMRILAEERRQKTDQLLYSLPLSMTRVVLGKYGALLAVLALPVIVMCAYPLILTQFGSVHLVSAYGTLLAFYLLSAALATIGMLISSLTESQAVAAGLGFVVMLLLYFASSLVGYLPSTGAGSAAALAVVAALLALVVRLMAGNTTFSLISLVVLEALVFGGYAVSPDFFTGLFPSIVEQLSLFERFYVFTSGVFDLTGVVYFLSIICAALFLCVQSLEKRRWS